MLPGRAQGSTEIQFGEAVGGGDCGPHQPQHVIPFRKGPRASISTTRARGRPATWKAALAGKVFPEEAGVDPVHRGEILHVREEDGGLQHQVQG